MSDIAVPETDDLEILYAATYDKVRLPWHYEAGGPESAVYKTTDAGASWQRLEVGDDETAICADS